MSSAFVAPALAQEGPVGNETDDENETIGPTDPAVGNEINESENETGAEDDEDGMGNWVSDAAPSVSNPVPSTGEFVDGIFEWVQDSAVGIIEGVLEGSIEVLIGTPEPGNAGWNGIFGQPTEEPFASLFEPIYEGMILPFTVAILSIIILALTGFLPYSSLVGSYRVYMWIIRLVVAIFALIFAWPVVGWMHQLSNDIAWAFAPESDEILSITGSLTLGSTAAPVAASIYLFGWIKIVLYAFVYFFRYQLLFWMPFVFPILLILALAAPHKRLRSFGSFGLWQYIGLLIMTWPNAMMFGAAYQLDWGFNVSSFANVGLIFGMFLTGILVPIAIMYAMAQGPGLVTGVMMGTASSAASGVRRRSQKGWKPQTSVAPRELSQQARNRAQTTYQKTQTQLSSMRGRLSRSSSSPGSNSGTSAGGSSSSSKEIKSNYGDSSGATTLAQRMKQRNRNKNNGD
ncbi:hypothetical protein QA600_21630 [Natronococcus sp. A-GB1]|uniref:hypothetical protein n=1 Tax=Natronococcus sp. A-GB1 TaxID=3037648 RepID=UPI00241C179E|nr:hypothetical protein [Natronococcus sp. A-GB1]MDG5761926.1 hypothetical protein [Natronococcus sp. A-GB1]